jgi:hypothetical protein
MATISNLYIDAGTTFSAIITVNNNDGSSVDLEGYTVAAQLRKSYGSTTAHNFTSSIYDASSGKIQIALTATQTSAIKPGRYLYDIEITTGSQKSRVAEGLVIVTPEITKI